MDLDPGKISVSSKLVFALSFGTKYYCILTADCEIKYVKSIFRSTTSADVNWIAVASVKKNFISTESENWREGIGVKHGRNSGRKTPGFS